MQVISGVNNSAFFAQSAYSASTAGYDVNGYPITSYLPESGVGYNAVNEISALNGSAIAQYGHEAQWLLHDDTLVHAANSAQYALGVNLSAVAQLLGVDETVLFNVNPNSATTDDVILSESRMNFDHIEIRLFDDNGNTFDFKMVPERSACRGIGSYNLGAQWFGWRAIEVSALDDSTLTISTTPQMSFTSAGAFRNFGTSKYGKVYKVIGIGRKQ